MNLEATGYYVAEWFEEPDNHRMLDRLEALISDLEVVSHATEAAIQRESDDEA